MLQELSRRKQDIGLSALTLSAGPLLILCGRALTPSAADPLSGVGAIGAMAAQSFTSLRRGSLQQLEQMMGLAAVGLGLLITLLALASALLAVGAVLAHRLGALRAEHLLTRLSPGFMRRTLVLTLSAHLAIGGAAAASAAAQADSGSGAQPELQSTQSISMSEATTTATPLFSPAEAAAAAAVPTDTASTDTAPADQAPPSPMFTTAEMEVSMTPLFTPTAPAAPAERHQGAEQRSSSAEEGQITVRPGDTLWGLVAADLGPGATEWEIAQDWPQWYEHNAEAIGEDPGALAPGIVLEKPPAVR